MSKSLIKVCQQILEDDCVADAPWMDDLSAAVKAAKRGEPDRAVKALVDDLAALFATADDMGELDAADFVDNAGTIFRLVLDARALAAAGGEA